MKRTLQQKTKRLERKVLGDALKLPTEHTNFGEPDDIFINGNHIYVQQ